MNSQRTLQGYKMFRGNQEFQRMRELLWFYKKQKIPTRFSIFQRTKNKEEFYERYISDRDDLVEIIDYCLIPTHIQFGS